MHFALHYSGQTGLQKSGGDVLYPSFEDIHAWKRRNSNHQKFLSTRYDEKQDTNHRNQQFRTKLHSILILLENEVAQQEQKVRANIDELEKKAAKTLECVKAKVQTSKGNETEKH